MGTIGEGRVDRYCDRKLSAMSPENVRKKLKQSNANADLVWSKFKIREGSSSKTRKTMEERICETDEF